MSYYRSRYIVFLAEVNIAMLNYFTMRQLQGKKHTYKPNLKCMEMLKLQRGGPAFVEDLHHLGLLLDEGLATNIA
jgi:hypothetical protein